MKPSRAMRTSTLLILLLIAADAEAQLRVLGTSPSAYGILGSEGSLTVTFSEPIDPATLDGALTVFGIQSGVLQAPTSISADSRELAITPAPGFAGERLEFSLSSALKAASGAELTNGFWMAASRPSASGSFSFEITDRWSPRRANEPASEMSGEGHLFSYGLYVGDVDEDGNLDVVLASGWSSDVRVFYGDGNQLSHSPEVHDLGSGDFRDTGNWPISLTIGDLDGDGVRDLVVTEPYFILPGVAGGGLAGPVKLSTADWDGGDCVEPAVLDANADGRMDVLGAHGADLQVVTPQVAVGAPWASDRMMTGFSGGPWNCIVGDFDADGIYDVVTHRGSGGTRVFRGLGQGGFQVSSSASAPDLWPGDFTFGDMDSDGEVDLVVTEISEDALLVLPAADLSASGSSYITGDYATDVELADLDGDGDLDVAIASFDGAILHENDGGNLSRVTVIRTGSVSQVRPGDFNGDGVVDLVFLVSSGEYGIDDELIVVTGSATSTAMESPIAFDREPRVYPNPTSGAVMLTGPAPEELLVVDLLGRVVLRVPAGERQFDLSDLPSGPYLIRYSAGATAVVVKQ